MKGTSQDALSARFQAQRLERLLATPLWTYLETVTWIAYRNTRDVLSSTEGGALGSKPVGFVRWAVDASANVDSDEVAELVPSSALEIALLEGSVLAYGYRWPDEVEERKLIAPLRWVDLTFRDAPPEQYGSAVAGPILREPDDTWSDLAGYWVNVLFDRPSIAARFPGPMSIAPEAERTLDGAQQDSSPSWAPRPDDKQLTWLKRPEVVGEMMLRAGVAVPDEISGEEAGRLLEEMVRDYRNWPAGSLASQYRAAKRLSR